MAIVALLLLLAMFNLKITVSIDDRFEDRLEIFVCTLRLVVDSHNLIDVKLFHEVGLDLLYVISCPTATAGGHV